MDRGSTALSTQDEFSLRDLVRELWEGRGIIILVTAAFSIIALAYALLATEIFRAQALVQPRDDTKAGGLAGLAAQFGGLADFAGISLGGGGDRAVAIATLRSRALIEGFIQERNLLPKMYPSLWDDESQTWAVSEKRVPTVWQACNDFLEKVLEVSEDKKTGLVTVAVEWRDPVEAQAWVADLIARTNTYLKGRAIMEGERNLSYLNEISKSIGQVEVRQTLFGLVESEMKKLMLAKAGDEFALKTIDPAVVPKRRKHPKRALVCIAGLLLGVMVGALVVLTKREFVKV